MDTGKLFEVKAAAKTFAQTLDLSRNAVAVSQFSDSASLLTSLTNDLREIEKSIDQIVLGGSTAMDEGLRVASEAIRATPGRRHILLFTDGFPDSDSAALSAARDARAQGVQILAIGTGDADEWFLCDLTGDRRLVLWASFGHVAEAFAAANRLITSASLVDASHGYELLASLCRVGAWTALLALGLGLALAAGQNCYLRRRPLSGQDALRGGGGSLLAGFFAGGIGQLLFWSVRTDAAADACGLVILGAMLGTAVGVFLAKLQPRRTAIVAGFGAAVGFLVALVLHRSFLVPSLPYYVLSVLTWALAGGMIARLAVSLSEAESHRKPFRRGCILGTAAVLCLFASDAYGGNAACILTDTSTRITGWIVLGAAMARGMAVFVPNLNRRRAAAAGGVGGTICAIAFLVASDSLGEVMGRFIGAISLGSSIGVVVALVEMTSREHWLVVTRGSQGRSIVNLGRDPVCVGSDDSNCMIVANAAPAVGLCYRIEAGRVVCEDVMHGRTLSLSAGDKRLVGGTSITVRSR